MKIIIFGGLENHYSFYKSIAHHHSCLESDLVIIDEKIDFLSLAKYFFGFLKSCNKCIFYIEEYFNLFYCAFLILIKIMRPSIINLRPCIHNGNRWVMAPPRFVVKLWLRFFLRKIVISLADVVVVVAANIGQFIQATLNAKYIFIPFRVKVDNSKWRPSAKNIISIPGNVEEFRRDYITVLDSAIDLINFGCNFELHFLGVMDANLLSEALVDRLSYFRNLGGKLFTYDSWISLEEFDQRIQESLVLIGNLVPFFVNNEGVEFYGITKETGIRVLTDSLGVPCILYDKIPPGENAILYSSYNTKESLSDQLLKLLK